MSPANNKRNFLIVLIDNVKKDIGDNIDNLSNIIKKSTHRYPKSKKEKKE